MTGSLSATRTATLVGAFDRSPAYAGLADALTLLIGDGRIAYDTRLPSERELTEALGVSRTTVSRAYAALRDEGYAAARQGAGTFARLPGAPASAVDRALVPRGTDGRLDGDMIDLNCGASSAPPQLAGAYAEAAAALPAYLGGHGYFPAGLPALQAAIAARYDARGLPTDPAQIMVTSGALSATAIVARAFSGPGDRVLVESPVYPNAVEALASAGARLVTAPVDPDGWDLDTTGAVLRRTRPRLAHLIADFHNPTGHLMSDAQREEYAGHLRRTGTVAVVDEAHHELALDPLPGGAMPRPFAAFAHDTITVGSASKSFWGGLRLGWVRVPTGKMGRLVSARVTLDLGAPVLEQLVLTKLLADPEPVLTAHRDRLRQQRDRLAATLAERLPEWRFTLPLGGQALWCELPAARATALTLEGERHGVVVTPGPVFAVEGGLDRFVRIPWTSPPERLEEAVRRLAAAWDVVRDQRGRQTRSAARVMVA
ncbi:MAG: PLP-dependent aminotransferase family protein [Lapillicoccus sp.]